MPVVFHLATSAHSSHPSFRTKSETRRRPWPASPKADATPFPNMSYKPSASHLEKNPAAPSSLSLGSESHAPPLLALPSVSNIRRYHECAHDSKRTKFPCRRASTPD